MSRGLMRPRAPLMLQEAAPGAAAPPPTAAAVAVPVAVTPPPMVAVAGPAETVPTKRVVRVALAEARTQKAAAGPKAPGPEKTAYAWTQPKRTTLQLQ